MNTEGLFAYARERYRIQLRRFDGQPKPWTDDPILQQYRFCCVFREDDKVTDWFRRNWRGSKSTVFGCVAFRFFNKIDTGKVLLKHKLLDHWDPVKAHSVLQDLKPLVGAAYVIGTPCAPGKSKLDGIIQIITPVWEDQQRGELDFNGWSLQKAHARLTQYPCIGSFMAYEAITDMANTPILDKAPDIMTWAAAGPGAARGLCRCLGTALNSFDHNNAKHRVELNTHMQSILEASQDADNWPTNWPKWNMRTVEHTCCEYDKICRARNGEGVPKQKYQGTQ